MGCRHHLLAHHEQVAYLSLVTDAYSCKIVGFHVHDTLQAQSVSQAFRMALKTRRSSRAWVHHSDRGNQYCSARYKAIRKHGLCFAMTATRMPWQSASIASSRTSSCCNVLQTSLRQARW